MRPSRPSVEERTGADYTHPEAQRQRGPQQAGAGEIELSEERVRVGGGAGVSSWARAGVP